METHIGMYICTYEGTREALCNLFFSLEFVVLKTSHADFSLWYIGQVPFFKCTQFILCTLCVNYEERDKEWSSPCFYILLPNTCFHNRGVPFFFFFFFFGGGFI